MWLWVLSLETGTIFLHLHWWKIFTYYLPINTYHLLSEELCVHGDLTQDGLVNISDILVLIDLIFESHSRNSYLKCAGDLNNDSGFNILDIAVLVYSILN